MNVHPSKNEIKIREERELFSMIEKQIRLSLINSDIVRDDTTNDFFSINSQSLKDTETSNLQNITKKSITNIRYPENSVQYSQNSFNDFFTSDVNKLDLLKEFVLLGQVNNSFIVGEYKNEISIIDQHAAHERINYEKH